MTASTEREDMLSQLLILRNGAATFGQKGSKYVLLTRDAFDAMCVLMETLTLTLLIDIEKKA